jgi:hypothetical protein
MTVGAGNQYRVFILLLTLILLSSCAVRLQPANEPPPKAKKIAVLPVVLAPASNGNSHPVPHSINRLKEGAEIFNQLLADLFKDRPAYTIINEAQQEALSADVIGDRTFLARTIAKQRGADAVLICTLYRFVERKGSSYGIEQPASVSFDFRLVATDDGLILCSGAFDETQKPLSDNLFNFKDAAQRGFKWITAPELLKEGLLEKFRNWDCSSLSDQ